MPTNIELENRVKDVEGYIQNNQGTYERQFKAIHETIDSYVKKVDETKRNLDGKLGAAEYNIKNHNHIGDYECNKTKVRATVGTTAIVTSGLVLIILILSITLYNIRSTQLFAENGYIQDTVKGSNHPVWRKADK